MAQYIKIHHDAKRRTFDVQCPCGWSDSGHYAVETLQLIALHQVRSNAIKHVRRKHGGLIEVIRPEGLKSQEHKKRSKII